MSGCFLSFEGIDGAGKSSHLSTLADAFRARGADVVCTREPGGTELAEKLRQLVLHEPMDTLTEALLMFAARRDHVQRVISPALHRGAVVLCDRFTDASFAYQGHGRGFDLQLLAQLERWVLDLPAPTETDADTDAAPGLVLQPQLTLWFDLPPDVAALRVAGARSPDRFEAEPAAFFKRVQEGYAARWRAAPQRIARIAADQPLAQVWAQVLAAVQAKGWLP